MLSKTIGSISYFHTVRYILGNGFSRARASPNTTAWQPSSYDHAWLPNTFRNPTPAAERYSTAAADDATPDVPTADASQSFYARGPNTRSGTNSSASSRQSSSVAVVACAKDGSSNVSLVHDGNFAILLAVCSKPWYYASTDSS